MDLYTAQYRYVGEDRLDITVKGQDPIGKFLAPTWDMVLSLKRSIPGTDEYTEQKYTEDYLRMLANTPPQHQWVWDLVLGHKSITLVCFCPSGAFCHRYLLKEYLLYCYPDQVTYMGERTL